MCNCSEIQGHQNLKNHGGHPIALVSIFTTLWEKSLWDERGGGGGGGIWPLHVRIRGNWAESVSNLIKNGAIVRFLGDPGTKMVPSFAGISSFQRRVIRRNSQRDDEAGSKSLEEKPWVAAGGPWVPAGGINCSLYAAMEFSSSFSVQGNLLRLVRNEKACFPWSFFAPSSGDLAWISNQVDPTRFFMIFSCGPYLQLRIAVGGGGGQLAHWLLFSYSQQCLVRYISLTDMSQLTRKPLPQLFMHEKEVVGSRWSLFTVVAEARFYCACATWCWSQSICSLQFHPLLKVLFQTRLTISGVWFGKTTFELSVCWPTWKKKAGWVHV